MLACRSHDTLLIACVEKDHEHPAQKSGKKDMDSSRIQVYTAGDMLAMLLSG